MTISEFHPCYMCVEPKRHIGCHGECEEYQSFTEERKRLAKEAHDRKLADSIKAEQNYERTTRYYRGTTKDVKFNSYGVYCG